MQACVRMCKENAEKTIPIDIILWGKKYQFEQ